MIHRLPPPAWRSFLPDITAQGIDFRRFHCFAADVHRLVMPLSSRDVMAVVEVRSRFLHAASTVVGRIRSPRAIPRMPRPWSAMAISCAVIDGHRP